ncbi:MAG: T9SS type A sorting domain-containing protein [Bacteroidia bacterium]
MKFLLVLASFVTALSLKAQLVITAADMPNPNDSIYIGVTYSIDSAYLVYTGAGVKWDFSTLKKKKNRYEVFAAPPFKSPYNFLFNFFNTSYGKDNYTLKGSPIKGITIEAAYDFFKKSATQYKQIGAAYTINGIPLPFYYSQPDIIYNFPMKYLNVDSCDYKFGLQVPSLGYFSQSGHRVNNVDGWGELKTPYGTFQTLRIKSTIATVDTIYLDTLSAGTTIVRPLRYEYKWFTNNMKIPVLQVDASQIGKEILVTSVEYIDKKISPPLGLKKDNLNNFSLQVYPNPAQHFLNINCFITNTAETKIYLTDVMGKTILSISKNKLLQGEQYFSVNTSTIANGIYFLNITSTGKRDVQKIIISH